MEKQDIRWKQRFMNYEKALAQLTKFIEHGKLNEFEEQGLIQCFEYTHELSWNVMKDFLENEGFQNIFGSKTATQQAFHKDLIIDGDIWMDMIKSRNESVHTYNETTVDKIADKIIKHYYPEFLSFKTKMKTLL
jgi:nucleotidyltransferase substrate binding protein (TIGR01987 family)